MEIRTVTAGIGVGIVILAVVVGLIVLGSPADQRARRLDDRRIRALQGITAGVDAYWRARVRLPESIGELARDPTIGAETKDPVSGQEYGYQVVAQRKYQLCAVFDRDGAAGVDSRLWAHPAGRHCFDLDVHEPPN